MKIMAAGQLTLLPGASFASQQIRKMCLFYQESRLRITPESASLNHLGRYDMVFLGKLSFQLLELAHRFFGEKPDVCTPPFDSCCRQCLAD